MMKMNIDLKDIKKKIYMSYFEDGLWDLLLGVYLLGWGISVAYDLVAIMGGIWVTAYITVIGLKRSLVYPRSGYIKLPEARRQYVKLLILGIILFVAGVVVFGLASAGYRPEWLTDHFMLILGGFMSATVLLLGYWWRVTRWFLYSGLMMLCFIGHQWFGLTLTVAFYLQSGFIILGGVLMLVRFLKRYPKSGGEETDVLS